jgi:hypothetical protein
VQGYLVEPTVLHDRRHVPPLAGQQIEIFERIAINHEQIGECAGRKAAKPALVAQHLCADQRRRANDFDRAEHLRAERELAALLDLELA